jgi:hypothetical protein
MFPSTNKIPEIDSFAETLLDQLVDAGAINRDHTRWATMYGPHGKFARFTFRQSQHGAPITLDLAPGLESGFGRAIEMLHDSGWRSIFGPEVIGKSATIGGEQSVVPEVVSPATALGGYLNTAWTHPELQSLYRKEPQRRFQYALYKGMELGAGAGGLFQYGPWHSEIARAEYSQRLRVGWEGGNLGADDVYTSILNTAKDMATHDPANPMAQLLGYGLYKEDSGAQSYRPLALGVQAATGGNWAYEAMGVGREGQTAVQMAGEMTKRFPISFGLAGVREQAYPMVPTGEYTMGPLEPEHISKSPESAGWKWLNAILPGETERRAAYVRPNMAFTAASPVPGQAMLYGGPGMPPGMAAFDKNEQINLPDLPMNEMQNVDVNLGIMRQTKLQDEWGNPVYQRVRPLEGATIAPETTATVGTMSYMHEGERVVQPINMTAGPTPLVLDDAFIAMPRQYNISTGEPLRHLEDPGARGVGSGGALATAVGANTGIPTYATARDDPYLQIGYSKGVWPTVKGFDSKQVLSELEAPFGLQSIGPEIMGRIASGVSGELKGGIGHFTGHFAGMTPREQVSVLGEFANVPGAGAEYGEMALAMQRYASGVHEEFISGQSQQERPIDMNVLSRIYGHYTGAGVTRGTATQMMGDLRSAVTRPGQEQASLDRYGYGAFEPEWFRWSYMSKEAYGDVFKSAAWGADRWLREEHGLSLSTSEGRSKFKESFPGRTVGESIRTHLTRFVPIDLSSTQETPFGQEGPMGYAEFRGAGIMADLVGGLVPEHSSTLPRLGMLERASIAMRHPKLARAAGIDLSMGPREPAERGTGLFPAHAQGWEEIGDVIRRNIRGEMRTKPKGVLEVTDEFAADMRTALAGMAGESTDYGALQEVVEQHYGDQEGMLYHPDTGLTMPRPISMSRVEASDFPEGSPFYTPLSSMSHYYPDALNEFVSGLGEGVGPVNFMEPTDETTRSLRRFYSMGLDIFEKGKGVDKLMTSSMVAAMVGGRYSGRFSAGLGNVLLPSQSLDVMISKLGQASDLPSEEKGRAISLARQNAREWQRFPGFLHRQPSLTTEGASLPTWGVPMDYMRQLGINIPEGTRVVGGKVRGGSIWESNLPFSAGFDLLPGTGDYDADQGEFSALMRLEAAGLLVLPENSAVVRELGVTSNERARQLEGLITRMYGTEGIVPGGAMNVFSDAWASIAGGVESGPRAPEIGMVPVDVMHEQAWATTKATGGMGVAYNMRRLLEASSASLMTSPAQGSAQHTSGALFYQEYLDKMTAQVKERGGFREVETMVNTSIWAADFQSDKLGLFSLPRAQGSKFVPMWKEGWGGGRMGEAMANALQQDIEGLSQPIGMEYPARLMAMQEEHVPVLKSFMEDAGTVTGGFSAYRGWLQDVEGPRLGVGPINYDPSRSVLGNAMIMSATFKTKGAFGKQPRMVETSTGSAALSLNMIGEKPVQYQGGQISLRSLANDPRIVGGEAAHSYLTHQGIINPRMIHTVSGLVSELETQGREVPLVFQAIMGTFGGADVAEEYAEAARKLGYDDEDRPYNRVRQITDQILASGYTDPRTGKSEIRGSSLNYIGVDFPKTKDDPARRGRQYHKYMEEYLDEALITGEVPGLEAVEKSLDARDGLAGQPDIIRTMPPGTRMAGKRVGLDLKTGKSHPREYAGQFASYFFTGQLEGMGAMLVPAEQAREIRKEELTIAREERVAAGEADRIPLAEYRRNVGRQIHSAGMANLDFLPPEELGPEMLQTKLEQFAGDLGIDLAPPVSAPATSQTAAVPTRQRGTTTSSTVINMLTGGLIGRRAPRGRGTGVPAGSTIRGGGPTSGGPPDDEPPDVTSADDPDQPEEPSGPGGIDAQGIATAFYDALQQTGLLVNVAHHSYTKSTRAAFRAAFQATRGTQAYMAQIPGQPTGESLTTLYGSRWAPELSQLAGRPFTGDVSDIGAASLFEQASLVGGQEFKDWAAQNIDLANQIQKAVGRPIEVSKGNLTNEVKEMLTRAGIDPSMVEGLQNLSSDQNRVSASITAAGFLSDYGKTELGTPASAGGGSRLSRLVETISDESLTKFADAVDSAAEKLEVFNKVVKESGEDSPEAMQAAAELKKARGVLQMSEAGMLLPGAVSGYQEAMELALLTGTDEAKQAAVQAGQDISGLISQYGAGEAAAAGPQGNASRFMRGLVGGWGLMYMSRLAKFPLTQAMYGYAEAEQFRGQMDVAAGGQLGLGVGPRQNLAMDTLRSQIEYGGQGMAAYQAMQADLPPMARDLQGMGLAGLAGGAGALYVGSVATQAGMKTLGARIAGAAPLVAGIGALAYAGMQAYSWRTQPEQTAVSYAAGMGRHIDRAVNEPGALEAWNQSRGFEAGRMPTLDAMGSAFRYMAMTPEDRASAKQLTQQMYTWREFGGQPQVMEFMRQYQPERLPQAAQLFAAEAPSGYDPNLAGATFLRQAGVGTEQEILDSVWAQMSGIDTPGMAKSLLSAGRQSWQRTQAVELENRITQETDNVYDAASLMGGAEIMSKLPVATLQKMFGKGYADELTLIATGKKLAPWSRSDFGGMLLQEGQLEQAAQLSGIGRMNVSGGFRQLDNILAGTASRREISDYANQQAREAEAIGVGQALGSYMPEATQAIYEAAYQDDQAAGLYAGAAELMPQAIALGIGKYQFLAQMAGRGAQGAGLGRTGLGIAAQYSAWGGQDTSGVFGFASANLGQSVQMQRLMSMDPIAWADNAMQGMPGAAQFATTVDVGLGGELTGLGWGTTSLARAGGPGAEAMAQQIWGDVGQGSDWRKAAVEGYETPFGKTVGGMRGLQWYQRGLQYEQQMASAGVAMAQIALQEEYMPQFWAVQDKQRALSHEQALWGFDMQQQQFRMQGTQFQENQGLQRRGQLMQRGWAQEDWAFQDQQRAQQWGWKVEDFEENVRFMSGRQRKLAERQMERDTIAYGQEGERMDVMRERQKEGWQLEDQRFELTKKHFNEQRTLQEENMKKQREFYDEGKRLQDEMIKLQREYQLKQLELQKAAVGVQAEYAKKMKEANDAMVALGEEQDDNVGKWKLAQSRQVDMINTIVDGMNWLIKHMPDAFKAMLGEGGSAMNHFGQSGGIGGVLTPDPKDERAVGGPITPGRLTIVGESGMETVKSSVPQHVFPANETFAAMLGGSKNMLEDPWAQTVVGIRGGTEAQRTPTTIVINIGNDRLGEFVLNTVNDALEVH